MNSLGHIKSLLDIQALRGFSSHSVNSKQTSDISLFEELLQQSISKANPTKPAFSNPNINKNSLGAVYAMSSKFHSPEQAYNNSVNIAPPTKLNKIDGQSLSENQSINNIIAKAAEKYNLPEKLIKSVIKHESNFNSMVVSGAGASGLMQLMPATARGLGVKDIFDPEQNVMGGSKYLRQMLDKYDGDIRLALAAYNAGPGNVDKYGDLPPFKETQAYVLKVTDSYFS